MQGCVYYRLKYDPQSLQKGYSPNWVSQKITWFGIGSSLWVSTGLSWSRWVCQPVVLCPSVRDKLCTGGQRESRVLLSKPRRDGRREHPELPGARKLKEEILIKTWEHSHSDPLLQSRVKNISVINACVCGTWLWSCRELVQRCHQDQEKLGLLEGKTLIIYIDTWFPVDGTIWEGLGGVALLEELCHWGWDLRFLKL